MIKSVVGEVGVSTYIAQALEYIKQRQLQKASAELEKALAIDFEHQELLTILKYVGFWLELKLDRFDDDFRRGDFLLSQWKQFNNFSHSIDAVSEDGIYAFRQYAFGMAYDYFQSYSKNQNYDNSSLVLRLGRCLKGLGNYDAAIKQLETGMDNIYHNAPMLAELGDCYAMVDDITKAKLFFREAFFVAPHEIDIDSLESELMKRLIEYTRQEHHDAEKIIAEWIPVYGVILGVFSVRRALRSVEYGLLRQAIYALEHELQSKSQPYTEPRLLYRYFWLIDHYLHIGDEKAKIHEITLKIQSLNTHIYKKYVN